ILLALLSIVFVYFNLPFKYSVLQPNISDVRFSTADDFYRYVNIFMRLKEYSINLIMATYLSTVFQILPVVAIAIVTFIFGSDYTNNYLKTMLSYPVSRTEYYISRFLQTWSIVNLFTLIGITFVALSQSLTNPIPIINFLTIVLLSWVILMLLSLYVMSIAMFFTVILRRGIFSFIATVLFFSVIESYYLQLSHPEIKILSGGLLAYNLTRVLLLDTIPIDLSKNVDMTPTLTLYYTMFFEEWSFISQMLITQIIISICVLIIALIIFRNQDIS
ncbi:MAG: hypothetical protein J7L07_12085, partial [Candidatus Odinarchaeota archaeon]|nr:hypothetical protein [Candidatus Odinarchaeota archaeon]